MKTGLLAEPILVGREHELKELQLCLNSAFEGKGITAFISGEAGSGKTRLSNEFLNAAREKQVTVLSGWCLSNAPVPFFPFAEAFDSYLSSNEAENKAFVSQRLGMKSWLLEPNQNGGTQKSEALTPQVWKDQTFSAVAKELLLMSNTKPTILFIDDIHWADSASLALLHYLARTIYSERILILATFRSEETLARIEGHPHPLTETLRLMGRESLFREVKLPNLNQSEVGKIAESMLGGNAKTELVEELAEESRGNPLFVVESLRMLYEQGNLVKEQGEWKSSNGKIGIPTKVKSVILRRIDSLKPNERKALDAASIVGEKFDPTLVADAVSMDIRDVLEALNAIEQSARLVHCKGNYYWFNHAKTREMLYDEIPPLLRKEYHLRIAQKIEALSQDNNKPSAVSDLAYHYVQAEEKQKSLKYSLAAGIDALAKFSNAEAIKYFSFVLQNSSETAENAPQRIKALEGLGDAYYAGMMFKEAIKTFKALANTEGANKLRALRKAMEPSFFQNDLARLEELLKEADKCDSIDRLESARILHNKARVFTLQGRIGYGIEYTKRALQIFEEENSPWDAAWTLIALGTTLPHLGKLEEGLAALLRSIAFFREIKDCRWQIEALNYAGLFGGLFGGAMQKGKELIDEAIRVNEDSKICDYLRLSQSYSMLAWMSTDLQVAVSKSLKALDYAEKTDSYWVQGMAYSNLTTYNAMLGDGKKAEEYYVKLMKLPPEVRLNAMVNAPLAAAYFFASKNQWEHSNQVFDSMLQHFNTNPNPGLEAMIKLSYSWVLNKQGLAEEAKKKWQEAQQTHQQMAKRLEHAQVYASLMAPKEVTVGQMFEARLDIANVSKGKGILISIEDLTLPGFKVITYPQEFIYAKNSIDLNEKTILPFELISIKLKLQAAATDEIKLNPKVVFHDDLGKTKESRPRQLTVTVKPAPKIEKEESLPATLAPQVSIETVSSQLPTTSSTETVAKFEFATEKSQKAFNYLADAFVQDYMRRRISLEKAGWRTLNEIVKETRIPVRSAYGEGHRGIALAELERRGLIETRIFPGERGRGGRILKARVSYEKEPIKRYIDQRVAKNA